MFRALLKAVVVVILLVGIAAFFIGYEFANPEFEGTREPVGTSGTIDDRPDIDTDQPGVDIDRARDTGAAVAGAVATGANEAGRALNRAAVTMQVKTKLAVDDAVSARFIDVDTSADGVVTLSGTIESEAARERALSHARETEGVTSVVDRLQVR